MDFPTAFIRELSDLKFYIDDLVTYIEELKKYDINWNKYEHIKMNNDELQEENYKIKDKLEYIQKIDLEKDKKLKDYENTNYQLRLEIEGLYKDIEALLSR